MNSKDFRFNSAASILALVVIAGCSGGGPQPIDPVPVVPVSGTVMIDGQAYSGVKVKAFPDPAPSDGKVDLSVVGRTDAEGKFQLTTYYQNDGAPVGNYILTFSYDPNPAAKSGDALQGRYNQRSSEHKLVVKGDEESVDVGTIELSTR